MSCATRQFSGENGDYLATANEIIRSPRGSYQVLGVLGRGTFGQVLKAWRADTAQLVALKVLKNIPSYTKQGQLEIDVLARLTCQATHEFNIVQAFESFYHSGHICISFELLEINLYDYLKQNKFRPLALKNIRAIAQQVLSCLQRLQELDLVHSDIKPENIMLVDQNKWPFRVKVIDFGSATSVSMGNPTSYLQSRYYRAPEVILNLPYTEAIDIWSLGCVLAELFLGWPLFPGSNEYDQISFIVSTLGPPPANMLCSVRKAQKFFVIDRQRNRWTLKTPQQLMAESGVVSKETRKYIFNSLSDLMRVGFHGNKPQSLVEQLDCLQFVALLTTMLTFDPSGRSSPKLALQSPFITMQHLAGHTSDPSVRDWIQCMYICRLSRTTNSSPPSVQPIPAQHSALPAMAATPQHSALPTLAATPQHSALPAMAATPQHSALPTLAATPQHSTLPAMAATPQPLVLPASVFASPLAFCPPPHPISYHFSPFTYLPHLTHHCLPSKSSLPGEDTGYASADSSPIPHLLLTECPTDQLYLHSLAPPVPGPPQPPHQLLSLHMAGSQQPHPLPFHQPPSTLPSLHPFSRL